MSKRILSIIISLLLCFSISAQDILIIKKGEAASQDGFLVSAEQMKKFREINEKKKLAEKKNITLKDLRLVQDERINFYRNMSEDYRKELRYQSVKSNTKSFLWFIGGVLITGAISYGTVRTLGRR